MGMELVDSSFSVPQIIGFLDSLLFIDHSLGILLVDVFFENLHSSVVTMSFLIEMFSKDTSEIATSNN